MHTAFILHLLKPNCALIFFFGKKEYLCNRKESQSAGLSLLSQDKRGKSGQHRALHFLTESCLQRRSNAEENNRPQG